MENTSTRSQTGESQEYEMLTLKQPIVTSRRDGRLVTDKHSTPRKGRRFRGRLFVMLAAIILSGVTTSTLSLLVTRYMILQQPPSATEEITKDCFAFVYSHETGNHTKMFPDKSNWSMSNCDGHYITDGGAQKLVGQIRTKSPSDEFCRALLVAGNRVSYEFTVKLKTDHPGGSGNPGIAFNVQNTDTFDVIYFRSHSTHACYQVGHMISGRLVAGESRTCPRGPPEYKVWFNVTVDVNSTHVKVYLNGEAVVVYKQYFEISSRVGIIFNNGYGNIISFKDAIVTEKPISVKPFPPSCELEINKAEDLQIESCKDVILVTSFDHTGLRFASNLNATETQNISGICSTLTSSRFAVLQRYRVSLNIRFTGHAQWVGISINWKDESNFDFIKISLRAGIEFACGSRINGVQVNSKDCPDPVSPEQADPTPWTRLEVIVAGERAIMSVNGRIVGLVYTHFPPGGRVGLFMPDSTRQIYIKDFTIKGY